MAEWNYIVIAATFFLLCFLVWKEIKRANKLRLLWRITASVAAAISLACMALPVTIRVSKNIDVSKEAILLTEGFDKDSLQTFLNNNDSKQFLVYYANAEIVQSAQKFNPKFISDIGILNHSSEKINAVHVFGYGFKKAELPQFDSTPFIFHPSEIPSGFTAINWQRKLASGDKFFLQGNFNNNLSHEVKLVLNGLHTNLDSVIIPANTSRIFELATVPKHLGRAIYEVFATDKTDTIEREDIPVEVTTPENMRILILAASPDFENKFLKNWLSENNYEVAIRARISKDKFQKQYINFSAISLDNISAAVLEKFDVLIADAGELASIGKSELGIIQSQVQKGLGLIVKADSSVSRAAFYSKDFSVVKGKENTDKPVALHLQGTTENMPALAVADPVFIRADAGTQAIIQDSKSLVFANSTIYGNGKIILTTLQNTYTLSLSGNHENYNVLWTLLLDKAAKRSPAKETVNFSPALPVLNEPVTLSVENNNNQMLPENVGEEKVYLQQNGLLPFLHTGTYWPAAKGWMPSANSEGKINWLFIYNKNNWSALQATKKIQLTKKYLAENRTDNIKNNKISKFVPVLIPKIYFFIIFILLAGFLWFEKKLP